MMNFVGTLFLLDGRILMLVNLFNLWGKYE
jgi:hypothetical protein